MQKPIMNLNRLFFNLSAYVLLPLLISVAIFDIIGRKFGNVGSTKLQELQWHFFFGSVMLSIGCAYLFDSHVRVDVLRSRFSPKLLKWIEIIGCGLALFPLSALLIWGGGDQFWRAFVSGERSAAAMGLGNRWIIMSVIPVGGVLLLLAGIYTVRKNIEEIRKLSIDAGSL